MRPDVIAELENEVETAKTPEAVTVRVATRDPDLVALAAPKVAATLHPDMRFGEVLWHEPCPPMDDEHEWSEAAVRVGKVGPR